jgi:FkbM family methyltransferase
MSEMPLPQSVQARRFVDAGLEESWREASRYGAPGLLARRAVERVARPFASRQARASAGIARAVEALAVATADASFPPALDAADAVEVATEHGPLLMHRADEIMTPQVQATGRWEPAEERFLTAELRPGATFLDVGASVGYFSVVGGHAVGDGGRVISVEPEARNLALLRANLWQHGLRNVAVLPIAAGDRTGYLRLEANESNRGDHQVHALGEHETGRLVPAGRLDEVLRGLEIHVVKIDTQGGDHHVVEGLRGLLRPGMVLLCEFWLEGMERRGLDPRGVIEGYLRLGLRLELLDDDGPVPTTPDAAVRAAAGWEGQWVNLVLRVP